MGKIQRYYMPTEHSVSLFSAMFNYAITGIFLLCTGICVALILCQIGYYLW